MGVFHSWEFGTNHEQDIALPLRCVKAARAPASIRHRPTRAKVLFASGRTPSAGCVLLESLSYVDVYGPRPIATAGLIGIDGHNC